ncbi:MAG: sodium-dependent bicarbonate transport family permease [Thiogranum sp.]|nr:sodium-dependent bicarbonate transport family permease [Thiogranum sp.]
MSLLGNLLIPAVLFFALGFLARLVKSDLRMPPDLAKMLSIYLLVAIGLHGGFALGKAELAMAFSAVLWAIVLGFALPLVGYALLLATRRVDPLNAAAIAAHYGSVSAGTFITAIAYLDNAGVEYESYPLIMLAVMESPAIIVGLLLASWSRQKLLATAPVAGAAGAVMNNGGDRQLARLLHDAFTNGSVMLLIGSMVIGAVSRPSAMEKLFPFVDEIFMGVLCLFLLEMGMEAARRIGEFRKIGVVLVSFGVMMPLVGALFGILVGQWVLGFGVGGTTLVAVLGASASYIAVPPAMRLAVPEANPSFYLTLSLGITFPFNVVVGIPLYHFLATLFAAA